MHLRRIPSNLPLVLLSALALLAIVQVLLRAVFEAQGILHTDVAIFLTVGRGLLNGLKPYIDLFETKSPGIFVFAAASLKLFGDARLLSFIQAVTVFLFPFALSVPAWRRLHSEVAVLAAVAAGAVLSLYAAEAGGHVFVEPVAAFFVCVLAALFASDTGPLRTWEKIAVGACFFLAVGLKEPFVLSVASVLLFLAPDTKRLQSALVPAIISIVVGILCLGVFGFFRGYFLEYLPHIFGSHIVNPWGTAAEPLWLRTIDLPRIAVSLWNASPVLPFFVALLWIGALILPLRIATGNRNRAFIIVRWALASWLCTAAVGSGGDFYHHHFVFAVPGYAACFLVCLLHWNFMHSCLLQRVTFFAFILFAAASLVTIPTWGGSAAAQWRNDWLEPRTDAANTLDVVMDRCGFDRYMSFIDRPDGVYGFTRHSPEGPIFQAYGRLMGISLQYVEAFANALERTQIMIMKEGENQPALDAQTAAYLRGEFSETPWECAGEFEQPVPYRIWFRNAES